MILPHAARAPWWLTLLTLCLFGWRFYFALNRAPLPSRWLVLGVALVAMLGVWIEYRTIFGRQPGILLLMLFAGLKLLETRTHRDAAAAAFLGYFLIVTNFLYTQTIPTAAAMCAALFALTATLVALSAPHRPARAHLRTAGLLLAHAAPAALAVERPRHEPPRVIGEGGSRRVVLQLWEWAEDGRSYALEFFANPLCDPSGAGEGEIPLGAVTVATDGTGQAAFEASFPTEGGPLTFLDGIQRTVSTEPGSEDCGIEQVFRVPVGFIDRGLERLIHLVLEGDIALDGAQLEIGGQHL